MVGAQSDLPLTAQGRAQATHFAQVLSTDGICPKAIYAGSLQRQKQTAEIVRDHLQLASPISSPEAALTEIDYGAWEGLAQEEIIKLWPREYADWTEASNWPVGLFGGTKEGHLAEIRAWITRLRKKYAPGDTVIAVTSNGIIRFFYSLQENEWSLIVKERQVEKLKVKTGHFCELHLFEDSIQIHRWGIKP